MCLPKAGLKAFLLILNVLLFLCGGIVLGIGIWAVADKIYISGIIGSTLFASASYMMVFCGVVLILLAFIGCFGGITDRKIVLFIYIISLLILFILMMTAGILAAVFQKDIESSMKESMRSNIRDKYGYNTQYDEDSREVTASWDIVQTRLRCCAVDDNGWFLYQNSNWFMQQFNVERNPGPPRYQFTKCPEMDIFTRVIKYSVNFHTEDGEYNQKFVPESCCVYVGNLGQFLNLETCQTFAYGPPRYSGYGGAHNPALHYQGCFEVVKEFVGSQSTVIMGIAFSFCVFLINSIIVAVLYVRALSGERGRSADLRH